MTDWLGVDVSNATCSIEGCDSRERCKGLCNKHYIRLRNHGDPLYRFKPEGRQVCTVEQCEKLVEANGLCGMHRMRQKRRGTTDDPVRTEKSCEVADCRRVYYGRGWCHKHYLKWYDHGDANYRSPGEIRNGLRLCARCSVDTPIEEYGIDRSVKSGRSIYCKPCVSLKTAEWFKENREQQLAARRRYSKRNSHLILAKVHRRNALKRKQFVEDVDRVTLATRDGWICGICGLPISSEAWPHPQSLSVDHIIPISRGGEHSYKNTQPTHLVCNMRKGARLEYALTT